MEVYTDYTNHSSETVGHVARKMGSSRGRYEKNALRVCGDWSEQLSSKGKIYFYNCITEVSQWQKPPEWKLPDMEPDELLTRLSNREHMQIDGKNLKRSRLQVVGEARQVKDVVYDDRCGSPKRGKYCGNDQSASCDLQLRPTSHDEPSRVFAHRVRAAPRSSPRRNCFQSAGLTAHPRRPLSDALPLRALPADDMDISPGSSPMSEGSSPMVNHRSPYPSKVLRTGLFCRDSVQMSDTDSSKVHRELGTRNGTSSRTSFSGQPSGTLRQLVDAIRASIGSLLDQSPVTVSGSPTMKSRRGECRSTFPDSARFDDPCSFVTQHITAPKKPMDDRRLPSPRQGSERELCALSNADKRQLPPGYYVPRENMNLHNKLPSSSLTSLPIPSAPKHANSVSNCSDGSVDYCTLPPNENLNFHQSNSSVDPLSHRSHIKSCRSTAECNEPSKSILIATSHLDSNSIDATPCRDLLSPSCSSHSSRARSQMTEELGDSTSRPCRSLDIQPLLNSPLTTISNRKPSDSITDSCEASPLVHSRSDIRRNSFVVCDSIAASSVSTSNPSCPSSYAPICANVPDDSAPLRSNNMSFSSDDPSHEEHCDRLTQILNSPRTQSFIDPVMLTKFSDKTVDRLEQEALLEARKFDRLQSVLYGELSAESKKLRALVRISEAKLAIHREKQTALQELMDAIETRKQLPNLSFSDDIV
ncbi:unnamed protein product [Dicrocoelium dendriticum]|nr:unnamed protein product [Dicrocoelium dendriticum]